MPERAVTPILWQNSLATALAYSSRLPRRFPHFAQWKGKPMRNRLISLAFAAISLALLPSCLVAPVPLASKTSAPPEIKRIDLKFLQPSVTTKSEFMQKMGWSDTGAGDDTFFIGRWSSSSYALVWAVGAYYYGAAGGDRVWTTQTLIAEFDSEGILQSSRVVPDRELVAALRKIAQRQAVQGRMTLPVELSLEHSRYTNTVPKALTVALTDAAIKFVFLSSDAHNCEVTPDMIKDISLPRIGKSDTAVPGRLRFTIHFKHPTKLGDHATFLGNTADLMALLRYQVQSQQVASAGPKP